MLLRMKNPPSLCHGRHCQHLRHKLYQAFLLRNCMLQVITNFMNRMRLKMYQAFLLQSPQILFLEKLSTSACTSLMYTYMMCIHELSSFTCDTFLKLVNYSRTKFEDGV